MIDHVGGRFAAGLRSYVHAVASEMGVESAAAWCEVAEPSVAYVAVRERALSHPDRDVMLLWDERVGWVVATEHGPGEQPVILARIEDDLVPAPERVAQVARSVLGASAGAPPYQPRSLGQTALDSRARISGYAPLGLAEVVVTRPRFPW